MITGVAASQSQQERQISALKAVPAPKTEGQQANLFSDLEVKLEDEVAYRGDSVARVKIYHNGALVKVVEACAERERGADGGYYSVVKLKRVDV